MSSIDYQEARKEIIKMFADDGERKVVFWYDPAKNFMDEITADNFDCCHVLICDKNEFSVKKTIEHDQPHEHFLVYIPKDKPVDTENWLLDIQMYSQEYYADTVALAMRRLGLSNPDLRRVIEHHAKFFDSESRVKKLKSFVEVNDHTNGDDLRTGMLCVLSKAASRSIESVLTELVFELRHQEKYAEIEKYGLKDFLWNEICRFYDYDGHLKLDVLIRKFFFTALLEQKADLGALPSFYDQYTMTGQGRMDAKFFVEKIKLDDRYTALQAKIAEGLKIEGLLTARDIACVQEADVFECIDIHIIKTIAESLKNGSLDYDTFLRIINGRMNSLWFSKHKNEYCFITSYISFLQLLEKPLPKKLTIADYIRNYTQDYYKIDYHYRHICAYYKAMEHPMEEFDCLVDKADSMYQDKFLNEIGMEYSDALRQQKEWRFAGQPMTCDFYKSLQQKNYKKCFVIISDGLRYEIGQELYDRVKVDATLKGSVEISCAVSPLPSETRFGMAALLPHKAISYNDGAVFVDGLPTNGVQARNAVLNARHDSYAAIDYETINGMSRAELRSYMADKSIVYVYHNVIDNAGEHLENKVFDVVDEALDEILLLIRKLYNTLQISNYYVTADHGFLYRRKPVHESAKYSHVMSMHPTEASKRYVLTNDDSFSIPYTIEFPLAVDEKGYRVVCPYGYDLFKTPGGGLQYIHGGVSLQETIVPVIRLSELHAIKNKDAISSVGVRLKSITRKITNRSFSLDFEQIEKVEGQKKPSVCETYIIDEEGNKVSGTYQFTAASTSDDAATRITSVRFTLMNIQFDRNKRYFLILRDIDSPTDYIEREQFIIDILAFKVL